MSLDVRQRNTLIALGALTTIGIVAGAKHRAAGTTTTEKVVSGLTDTVNKVGGGSALAQSDLPNVQPGVKGGSVPEWVPYAGLGALALVGVLMIARG